MSNLDKLLQQYELLQKEIDTARKQERRVKIKDVRVLLEKYSLTAEDIFPQSKTVAATTRVKSTRPAKYRDPASGKTWSGAGRAPLWIRDHNYSDFLITDANTPSESAN